MSEIKILRHYGLKKTAKEAQRTQHDQTVARTMIQGDPREVASQMRESHHGRGPHGLSVVEATVRGGPHWTYRGRPCSPELPSFLHGYSCSVRVAALWTSFPP